ncbi:MAG: DUF3343 domain-containing protein [Firmicutes bacterium]|nr:DUF3343 domain-containing protein [Bacillota bacterium]
MVQKCYFTFPTTHQAIRAEKVLLKTKKEFKVVPVPREISSSCGVALCCTPGEAEGIKACLESEAVIVEGFYTLEEKVSAGLLSFLRGREKRGE